MPDPADDALRDDLLEQLAYLVDEIEALKAVVPSISEPLQTARPLADDLSVREYYGLLAVRDEAVHLPHLEALADGRHPAPLADVDDRALATAGAWNDQPLPVILERVQHARRTLVEALRALPPDAWTRDVYALAHAVTQHDVDLLRAVSQRLYEGRARGEGGRG